MKYNTVAVIADKIVLLWGIEKMDGYIARSEIYSRFFNGGNGIARIHVSDIDVIPLADVVPVKHGQWENGCPICPVCGMDKFSGLDADVWADWQPKYCPNCGAKMQK